jgi:hypothetical protein
MLMLMILSTLFGAVLGTRFKVWVLFPTIFVSAALLAVAAAAHGSGLWSATVSIVLCATGLQIGFLGGVATRFVVATARAPRLRGTRPTTAASGSAR